ncbi:MAG: hypothetical protein H6Q04_1929 [Acidobacteria bacterium]|nr:hypothetical protein [Acidobacteriota bacterium]
MPCNHPFIYRYIVKLVYQLPYLSIRTAMATSLGGFDKSIVRCLAPR